MMRSLIIGKKGIGKTTLIAKKIIPSLDDYLIFDFCHEYSNLVDDKTKILTFEKGLVGNELKQQVIDVIHNTKDITNLIIDNTQLLYFPTVEPYDKGFSWLARKLADKNYIFVFQSVFDVINIAPDIFESVYCFPTRDTLEVRAKYFISQKSLGVNVVTLSGF